MNTRKGLLSAVKIKFEDGVSPGGFGLARPHGCGKSSFEPRKGLLSVLCIDIEAGVHREGLVLLVHVLQVLREQ